MVLWSYIPGVSFHWQWQWLQSWHKEKCVLFAALGHNESQNNKKQNTVLARDEWSQRLNYCVCFLTGKGEGATLISDGYTKPTRGIPG